MWQLVLAAAALAFFAGCAPWRTPVHTISDDRLVNLGVPLASEEGAIKLVTLEYVSKEVIGTSQLVRFVPLSEVELQEVHERFAPREVRPAGRAESSPAIGMRDRITKEQGMLLAIGEVHIKGKEAEVGGGYTAVCRVIYTFYLANEGGHWRVRAASPPTITE